MKFRRFPPTINWDFFLFFFYAIPHGVGDVWTKCQLSGNFFPGFVRFWTKASKMERFSKIGKSF